jgi:DNA (cytosine-5)-methyltransferase 1
MAKNNIIKAADLFCGVGGTSAGLIEACELLNKRCELTAVNHWQLAVATHSTNHGEARHLCASLDSLNPLGLFGEGELDVLWASPECTHHSNARGGKPILEQSRATAWCVTRWAEAVRPDTILVENVKEFQTWGPVDSRGRRMKSRSGEVFRAWRSTLEALGYTVEHRIICAADYGDPTTRERLIVYAVRGKRKVVWPWPTHQATSNQLALPGTEAPAWVPAHRIIDWSMAGKSIYEKGLCIKTLQRVWAGLIKHGLVPFLQPNFGERKGQIPRSHGLHVPAPAVTGHGAGAVVNPYLFDLYGTDSPRGLAEPGSGANSSGSLSPFLVQFNHGPSNPVKVEMSRMRSLEQTMPVVCGQRGEWGLVHGALLPQQSDGVLRSIEEAAPTVATRGAIGFIQVFAKAVKTMAPFPGSSDLELRGYVETDRGPRPVVNFKGQTLVLEIFHRMLDTHELAAAQGFRPGYKFIPSTENYEKIVQGPGVGNNPTKTNATKMIGNAVPRRMARALVLAALTQNPDIRALLPAEDEKLVGEPVSFPKSRRKSAA